MRFRRNAALCAALAAICCYLGGATADEKKTLDIKGCMKCQNSVRNSIIPKDKGKDVDWDAATKKAKTWLAAAEDLGKNKPPLGDEKSWKDQTEKYLSNVKAVDEAVEKKDTGAVSKALGTVGASCGACHKNHKPK